MTEWKLYFRIYEILVLVCTEEEAFVPIINFLSEDLNHFVIAEKDISINEAVHLELKIKSLQNCKFRKPIFWFFKTKNCRVGQRDQKQVCDYRNSTFTFGWSDRGIRYFEIVGQSSHLDSVYEVSYLALLSAIGEELDLKGYHRIHALGISAEHKGYLVLLKSGGGKSAMASIFIKNWRFSIFSDEMPLIKKGVLYPFPVRIALAPNVAKALKVDQTQVRTFKRKLYPEKLLFPIPKNQISTPCELREILIGSLSVNGPEFKKASPFFSIFALFTNLVVGLGLSQMSEHMIRRGNFLRLAKIFISRLKEAFSLNAKFSIERYLISYDAFKNADSIGSRYNQRRQ